jgi:short-subunit dehydrogenase
MIRKIAPWLAAAAAYTMLATILRRSSRFDFGGKVVLIAGGGRGLGLELARAAAERGATLALVARSPIELDAAAAELRALGTVVETAVCDVRSSDAVSTAFAELTRKLGDIDVLVNDAGVIEVGPIDALLFEDYENAMQTNVLGAIRAVEHVRESMCARGAGRIINITSIGGKIPVPHLLPYCTSKFAFVGYSLGLRAELARYGVVVTTVVPGLMRTGSPPNATFAGQPKKEYMMFAPGDSLPLSSVSVRRAAREILDGCERGDIETIVSWQAKAAIALYALAPRVVTAMLATLNRTLPDSGGSTEHRVGRDSESALTRSPLDALGHAASRTQHELLESQAPQQA